MRKLIAHRYLVRQNLLILIGLSLFVYFGYHLLQGERSYFTFMALDHMLEQRQSEHAQLLDQRTKLEQRVKMMRPESLDRDMLEEQVLKTLHYSHEDDKVILLTN